MKNKHYLLIVLLSCGTLFSCQKEEEDDPSGEDEEVVYESSREQSDGKDAARTSTTVVYEDATVYTYAQYESDNNTDLNGRFSSTNPIPSCATVSVESDGILKYPKTLTIDFGSTGCVCDDGKTRKGVITAKITDSWVTPGGDDSVIVNLTDYYVDGNQFTGYRHYVKNSLSTSSISLGVSVVDASIVYANGEVSSWDYSGNFELQRGSLGSYADNVLEIDLSGTVVDSSGASWDLSMSNPLVADFSCLSTCLFKEGDISLTNVKQEDIKVGEQTFQGDITTIGKFDFGTGICDDQVDLSVTVTGELSSTGSTLFSESASQTITCGEAIE